MISKLMIIKLITYYSVIQGFDPKLAIAVATVESNLTPNMIGSHKEIGLFQINPKFFKNPSVFYNIHMNIQTGINLLKNAKNKCKHQKAHDFLVCYNVGIKGGAKIKYPRKFNYVKKVNTEYGKLNAKK